MARIHQHPYTPLFLRSDVSFEMPRVFNSFSGDVSGRYIELLSIAGQCGCAVPGLAEFAERLLTYQQPRGFFGAADAFDGTIDARETMIFWGNGRLLIGLMEYYQLSGDAAILAAARRLVDFWVDLGAHRPGAAISPLVKASTGAIGFATTFCSCIEGVVRLYTTTGDKRYAGLAHGMAALLPETFKNFHSHGRLTALRGMADLAVATGDARLMARVVRLWEKVAAEHVTCLGGVGEYFRATCPCDEGCSIADWVMLSLKLHAARGESRFLEAAEHGLLNHLLANQFENGGFGSQYFIFDAALPGAKANNSPDVEAAGIIAGFGSQTLRSGSGFTEAYWCCSFHGPRAIFEAARYVATPSATRRIDLDLFLPVDVAVDGVGLQIRPDPELRGCRITIARAPGHPVTLRLRVPVWSGVGAARVQCFGASERVHRPGRDRKIAITRTWQAGDVISLDLNPDLHIRPGVVASQRKQARDRDALFIGPYIMGYDCSDCLLCGQAMPADSVPTVLLIKGSPGAPSGLTRDVIVEYSDPSRKRTIWVVRRLIPLHRRMHDQPLRTIHTVTSRAYAQLTHAQREALAGA